MRNITWHQFVELGEKIEEFFGESIADRIEYDDIIIDEFKRWIKENRNINIDRLDQDDDYLELNCFII